MLRFHRSRALFGRRRGRRRLGKADPSPATQRRLPAAGHGLHLVGETPAARGIVRGKQTRSTGEDAVNV